MKKTAISLLLMTALLGSLLTACSDSNSNSGTPNTTNPPTVNENNEVSPAPSDKPDESEEDKNESSSASSTDKIVSEMFTKIEQPGLMDQSVEILEDYYRIDSEIVDAFTLKTPAINLMANEIAVIKVKDANDIDTVKKGMEQRAEDVQKMFESYLPEPYKHAQNYKIATNGNYVLFIISESADELEKAFMEYEVQ